MKARAQALLLCFVVLAVAGGLSLQFRAEIDQWIFRDMPYGTGKQTAALAAALREIDRQHIFSIEKMNRDLAELYARTAYTAADRAALAAERREHAAEIERMKVSFRQRYGTEPLPDR